MGFFKKVFGDAADELKKSLEESKNEMRKSLEDMKRSAMADFGSLTSSKRSDNDDDDDEPRIILGKFSNGVLDIRDDIEELDDESLEDYKNVKMIIFPRGLKKLDSDVICDQSKLEELDFSFVTELREIPDDFISGATKIKEFIVPQGVKKLGDGFVGDCKAGTKIVIPSTVEKIGYINGENNNDLLVYLFAPKLNIENAEEDIKTLYVLPEYYGYYAKQLKKCDSEARLREMPEDMMNIYSAMPEKKELNKPSSLTPPDKMEFQIFDESENKTLFEHGFRFAQVPESGDVIYDIVNLEDSDLYLRKTNDNRYYRFYMYSPGELCVDKDFRAYSKVEHTEFDLARYFKDYENDETEGDSEYDVDKKLFYGVEKNTKAPSQEYLPLDWEFVQFDEDENEYLGKHGFTYPRDTDVIYDIVGHDDYELFLVKTNNGRYFRFDPFGTGRLQIDADLNAYGIVEVTPFDFERFCKDYENDEVEDDLDEYEIEDKKAFYSCEQKAAIPPKSMSALKAESVCPTPLDGLVQKIKDELQSHGLLSFTLYATDYAGDRDEDEIEQLGDDGLLEYSSEYHLYGYDVDDGNASVYITLRKISIIDDIVVFDTDEEYEDNDGDYECRGEYKNQTIGNMLNNWDKDSVENGLTNVLNYYLNNKTLIELNGGSEAVVVKAGPIAEPAPEPEPIPEPKPEPQIATTSKVLTTNERRYEIRDFKKKKMDDLRIARNAKDQNKAIENINRWKQIIADIQVIDNALKGGARTLDELKETIKQNESLVAEINEFLGISEPQPDPKPDPPSVPEPEPIIVSEPVNSVYKGLFSERLEALISSALQDGVLTDQEIAVLKKRAEKEGEDWDEVEMIINSRLAEIKKANGIQIQEPLDEQVNRKKPIELNDIKRALLFLSYKSCEESDYAFLFLIDKNKLYATNENYNTPEIPSCDYFEELDDFECWIENISNEYQSFKQLSESLVDDFTDARLEEFEGDTSALAIDSKYTITIFVGDEKVYEETVTCR